MHQRFQSWSELGLSGQSKPFRPRIYQGSELATNPDISAGQWMRIGDWICGQAVIVNTVNGTNGQLLYVSLPVTPGRILGTGFGSAIHGMALGNFIAHRITGAAQYAGTLVAATAADSTVAPVASDDIWAKLIAGSNGADLGQNNGFTYEANSILSYSFGYFSSPTSKYT